MALTQLSMDTEFEELSEEQLKAIFEKWDTNRDNYLSLRELQAGLAALKLPCTEADLAHYSERFRCAIGRCSFFFSQAKQRQSYGQGPRRARLAGRVSEADLF